MRSSCSRSFSALEGPDEEWELLVRPLVLPRPGREEGRCLPLPPDDGLLLPLMLAGCAPAADADDDGAPPSPRPLLLSPLPRRRPPPPDVDDDDAGDGLGPTPLLLMERPLELPRLEPPLPPEPLPDMNVDSLSIGSVRCLLRMDEVYLETKEDEKCPLIVN